MSNGWRRTRIDKLVEFRNGMNFTQESRGQSIKVVGVGDFLDREILSDFSQTNSVVINGQINADDLLAENDLLFVRSNGNKALVGRCVIVKGVTEPISFSGFTIRARIKADNVDPSFLSKIFRSHLFHQHLHWFGCGSSISNLSQDVLSNFSLDLPPLPEQRKIAAILRTWDEAIEKLDALITSTERQHRTLTHSLVFGQMSLAPFRRSNGTKAFRWFSLPSSWECLPIGAVAIEISERHGKDEAAEVLSCSKYDGFVRSLEYFKKRVFSTSLEGYKKIWRGDFGFPSNHIEEGSIGYQNIADFGLVSPIYTVFRFAPEQIDSSYAYSVLKTSLYRHIFDVSTSASVDRRGSLRWSEFSKIPFPIPPFDEQRAIAEVLSMHSSKLAALAVEKRILEQQKRGLMQKLLTEEWRVKC